jgi:hypothetical protein
MLAQVRNTIFEDNPSQRRQYHAKRLSSLICVRSCKWLNMRMLSGGAEGDRTPDLRIANAEVSGSKKWGFVGIVTRFEP